MKSNLADQAAALFGLNISSTQLEQFARYGQELAAWNAHTNLTAITDPDAVVARHFLDSLSIASVVNLEAGLRVIDVGTGAGFPGLPLKIVFPQTQLTLLESTGKKIAFLDHVVALLGLHQVQTLHARAEEAGHMTDHRAVYDLVLARAVARLPALVEYLLPLAKVGGQCIAMKGETAATETQDAARAVDRLGGSVQRIEKVTLPGVEDTHYLIIIDKVANTPAAYPRKPGLPTRQPIL
jgi:16S rRNA (guanine527-N7)-methyltransferase